MMVRPRRLSPARLLATVLVVVLTVAGCAGAELDSWTDDAAQFGAGNDINPHDPAELQQGGNLRLALTALPQNFNTLHIDGNVADTAAMMRAVLPRAFRIAPDGTPSVNTDYFTSVELTGTDPQVVTWTINPEAVWTDGTPITWEDIAAQIHATSGKDPEFAIASNNGADRVESVTMGVDDRQAVMTFAKPYAEWRGMLSGNTMLLPKSMTATPEAFNTAQLNAPGPTAGPFLVSSIDRGAQRIVLTRNPDWWGDPPLLDSITHSVLDTAARLPALQNNALDATGVGTLDELIIAQRTRGISIRRAPGNSWYHFTFNGAPGSILADKALRQAIAKGIDRQTIANVTQRGLAADPEPLNNRIFVAGQEGYQDNSAVVTYNPEQAAAELDALGWRLNGQFREKDGQRLVIRNVLYDSMGTRQFGLIAQNNLAQIGVQLELDAKGAAGFFSDYIITGDFDIAQFGWVGDAYPLSGLTQIYATTGDSNFGKIGSPEIDAKIEETLAELDPARARELANEVDEMLWDEVFNLPLTQSSGSVAVRSNLANYGAFGLGDPDYTKIGFLPE